MINSSLSLSTEIESTVFRITLTAFIFWVVLLGVLMAITWPLIQLYNQQLRQSMLAPEREQFELIEEIVLADVQNLVEETLVMASLPRVQSFLANGAETDRILLSERLLHFAAIFNRYDQVRVLSAEGMELIRINHRDDRPVLVPQADLQDKSDRDYFLESLNLTPGEIYMSDIDLNVEQGQIEVPLVPMMRIIVPIYDEESRLTGLFVVNHKMKQLLDRIQGQLEDVDLFDAYLIDKAGYFLVHPDSQKTWGHLLNRPDSRLDSEKAALAAEIDLNETGEFIADNGVYLFQSMRPQTFVSPDLTDIVVSGDEQLVWRLILYVPDRYWRSLVFYSRTDIRLLIVIVLIVLYAACWFIAASGAQRRRLRKMRAVYARELNELYERAPCGYHSLNSRGVVVRMNQTELDWLGYSQQEVINKKRFVEFLRDDSREVFEREFHDFVAGRDLKELDLEMVSRSGDIIPVAVNGTAVRDRDGNFIMSRTVVTDMTENRALRERLSRLALTDELTGVANRRHFYETAELEIARCLRENKPFAVFMLDIDFFKKVNDTHGHGFGDTVLKELARTCQSSQRINDLFGRLGGEEFGGLLSGADLQEAIEIANRLRQFVAGIEFELPSGGKTSVTVSIGVAEASKVTYTLEELLKLADENLYKAKKAGRNQVVGSAAVP